jgi:hypothetical protein
MSLYIQLLIAIIPLSIAFHLQHAFCHQISVRGKSLSTVKDSSSESEGREWGQSFIGQDVCGSRYNDDPFAEQGNKPDAWEEMKKRIKAIEDKEAAQNKTKIISK